eukprot:CAMPEP_0184691214 /NCGR_PEP_ID=MMETSP0313-20130426/122_1 /TAXON_ID=2792 /ORGANISM="Porphyridium aerugineum, Strain SAG 1380-2" /LENGTH=91 /DNA_ID=CAMNT_0027148891 /DNA_START=135 /DNA_END=410 /DNA_ORIENTATION=-
MAFVSALPVSSSVATKSAICKSVAVSRRSAPRVSMSMEAAATDVMIKSVDVFNTALLMASKETDFGGYTIPAIGLLSIGALILALAPPLKD